MACNGDKECDSEEKDAAVQQWSAEGKGAALDREINSPQNKGRKLFPLFLGGETFIMVGKLYQNSLCNYKHKATKPRSSPSRYYHRRQEEDLKAQILAETNSVN